MSGAIEVIGPDVRRQLVTAAFEDRFAAHEVFFRHRHRDPSAPFHRDFIADFWSDEPDHVTLAFRDAAKSTYMEEAVVLAACERAFHNILIVGASEARAAERLASIARELESNESLLSVYGEQKGSATWTQTAIELRSGVFIQAKGRDQDIRGIKHGDWRPDLILVDDFESRENVQTTDQQDRTMVWVLAELLPACDPSRRVRVYSTPMGARSVPVRLIREDGWPARIVPIVHLDEAGIERASWPARFPMEWVERTRARYRRLGQLPLWGFEYLCDVEAQTTRTFRPEMIRVEPRVKSWQACWAMFDPARTVRRTSSTTGWAVWSWIGRRLVVWDAGAEYLLPDQIIARMFDVGAAWNPIEIGIEEDGLNEFVLQPLRQEQVKRGVVLPYRGVRAPRGKQDFILGLQPFFAAGEVVFARDLPEMREQLLSFPGGRIDAPNALAYSMVFRAGEPLHDLASEHIAGELAAIAGTPLWLAVGAKRSATAAVLCQHREGRTRVLADWLREGDPGQTLEGIVREAALETGQTPVLVAGPQHFDAYLNVGLVQAAKAVPLEVRKGSLPQPGRLWLRREMERRVKGGEAAVEIAERARWTLNGLNGGFARRGGGEEPVDNHYRLVIEGLESFCGLLAAGHGAEQEDDGGGNFAYGRDGKPYRSAMPGMRARR